jgi:hypothetical protein
MERKEIIDETNSVANSKSSYVYPGD